MNRHRVRIRFRKELDLVWLGHRDLVRVWERAFRRAGVEVNRSQGCHPRPRLAFPSALAAGLAGLDEVFEAELAAEWRPDELEAALAPQLPPGLSIASISCVPSEAPAVRVRRVEYVLPLAGERLATVERRLAERTSERSFAAAAAGRDGARLECEALVLHLMAAPDGGVRFREALDAFDLRDAAAREPHWRRTIVELAN